MTAETFASAASTEGKAWGLRRWLIFGLKAAAPFTMPLLALGIVYFVHHINGEFGVSALDDRIPDTRPRLIGAAVVVATIIADAALLIPLLFRRKSRGFLQHRSGPILDALSCNALIAIGMSFAVFDMAFGVAESMEFVLVALTLGLVGAWPLFLGRGRGVRRLLLAVAVYGTLAGWVAVQRHMYRARGSPVNVRWPGHRGKIGTKARAGRSPPRREFSRLIESGEHAGRGG
jgi:hypothetical protein